MSIPRPSLSQIPPYFQYYIGLVSGENILEQLENQRHQTASLFLSINEETALFRYAERKWSIKEMLGHLNDAERVFAYRALAFARNDRTELPGFNENDYVTNAHFDHRTLKSLVDEYTLLRQTSLSLYLNVQGSAWNNVGYSNGQTFTLSCMPYITLGHEIHHLNILKERYLLTT